MTSRWPSVVSRPTLAPLCSSSALVATVVPCTMRSVCARRSAGSEVEQIGQAIEAGHHADRGVLRRGSDLCQRGVAGVVHRDQVGEGAADVDADLQHGLVSEADRPPPQPSPASRERGSALSNSLSREAGEGWGGGVTRGCHSHRPTNPLISSLLRAAGSRFAGSPHPPPPPDSIRNTSPGLTSIPTSLVLSARCCRPSECST